MIGLSLAASAQTKFASVKDIPVMETGGKDMPDEWIDKDTRITIQLRTCVMTIDREPLIAQMIATDLRKTQLRTSFE